MSRVLFRVWFRIQRIIKKCRGYYSAYGSVFSVLCKNVHNIIQRLVQYSGYYSKYDLQRLVQDSGYYSKIRPAASDSGLRVLLKNVQGISQRLVQYSGYYSKYDLQRLVHVQRIIQNTTCSVWFRIQSIIQNTTSSIWFRIQRFIKKVQGTCII